MISVRSDDIRCDVRDDDSDDTSRDFIDDVDKKQSKKIMPWNKKSDILSCENYYIIF